MGEDKSSEHGQERRRILDDMARAARDTSECTSIAALQGIPESALQVTQNTNNIVYAATVATESAIMRMLAEEPPALMNVWKEQAASTQIGMLGKDKSLYTSMKDVAGIGALTQAFDHEREMTMNIQALAEQVTLNDHWLAETDPGGVSPFADIFSPHPFISFVPEPEPTAVEQFKEMTDRLWAALLSGVQPGEIPAVLYLDEGEWFLVQGIEITEPNMVALIGERESRLVPLPLKLRFSYLDEKGNEKRKLGFHPDTK